LDVPQLRDCQTHDLREKRACFRVIADSGHDLILVLRIFVSFQFKPCHLILFLRKQFPETYKTTEWFFYELEELRLQHPIPSEYFRELFLGL
jgi:hypothetical protein